METDVAVSKKQKISKGGLFLRVITILLCILLLLFAALNVTMTVLNARSAQGPGFLFGYSTTVMNNDTMAGDKADSIPQDSMMFLRKEDPAMDEKEKNELREDASEAKRKDSGANGLALGMCLGLAIGTAVGAATGNLGLWMPIGLCLGLALGGALKSGGKEDAPEDTNEDGK